MQACDLGAASTNGYWYLNQNIADIFFFFRIMILRLHVDELQTIMGKILKGKYSVCVVKVQGLVGFQATNEDLCVWI